MIRLRRESKPILLENKSSLSSGAKKVWMGGDHPVVVQSMTTTDTADVEKTLTQIYELAGAGCEVVRVTVKDAPDAACMAAIVARSPVPIVADIHFDHKMALAALEAGVAKLRLNPGNITDRVKTREVVRLAKDMGTPIRIGVNMGSLAADLEKQIRVLARKLDRLQTNTRQLEEIRDVNSKILAGLMHDIQYVEQDIGLGNLAITDDGVEPKPQGYRAPRRRNAEPRRDAELHERDRYRVPGAF